MACPILLMLSSFAWRSAPSAPNASSSKKHQVVDPLDEELVVADALLLVGGEHRALARRLPLVDDLDRPPAQLGARLGAREALDDEEPVAVVRLDLGVAQHAEQATSRVRAANHGRICSSSTRRRTSYGAKPLSTAFVTSRSISAQVRSNALRRREQLRRRHHVAHQPVVGVDADVEAQPQQRRDRVLVERRDGTDLHVAGRCHLEVHLPVEHVPGERAERRPVPSSRQVMSRCSRTPWPMRWAPCTSASSISSRSGGSEAWIVTLRWRSRANASASACSDGGHPVSAPARSNATTLSSCSRIRSTSCTISIDRCSVRIAQRMACTTIGRPAAAASRSPRRNPAVTAADDGLERQPALLVQLGSEPHLGVHDAVGGEVERALVGDALDVLLGLHHGERVLERGEVLQQVLGCGAGGEPRLQLAGVGRGERPADLVGELDDRWRPAARRRGGRAATPSGRRRRSRRCRRARRIAGQSCWPLKYGMPSAAGGRSRCAKIVTTTSVTTYGVMYTNWSLTSSTDA